MSYGMLIQTTNGLVDITTIRSIRRVAVVNQTASSGSGTLPAGLTNTNCIVYAVPLDGLPPPQIFISSSTTYVWNSQPPSSSSNFNVVFGQYA